uniref:Uncharacterized protein n=1 Tax=Lactuca sativa TaxID=4236 RepID=A0A9R1VRH4_LACSA|nr:hypothetical protein LSAT_V11C400168150 [Lactuca sativa]
MAFSSISWSFTIFFIILQMLIMLWSGSWHANGCYTSIFSFGDSLTDTDNLKQVASITDEFFPFLQPPYGETFFHKPTSRCSDGRLIIDFLAESLGLPLVRPFLHDCDNVIEPGQGVNYAVVGATALNSSFLEARGIVNDLTNASLGVQLAWFKQSLASICSNVSGNQLSSCSLYSIQQDCRNLIGRSLILVGEIGGNDYNYPITDGKPIDEVEPFVPLVTDTIVSAVDLYRPPTPQHAFRAPFVNPTMPLMDNIDMKSH